MGYGEAQLADLRDTLEASGAEVVVSGTPLDLARLIELDIPVVRARYAYADAGPVLLGDLLGAFLERSGIGREHEREADVRERQTREKQE
jgi:predicted GTPase